MDDKDLKQIKETFREGFKEIWEGNLGPAFNAVYERIDQLPTKAYLDDKIANLEGTLIVKLRKEDEKLNRLAEILRNKNILSDSDIAELANLQVFPK